MRRIVFVFAAAAAALALAASPAAAPGRHRAAAVTISKVSFSTSWRASAFVGGRLVLRGKASAPATIGVGWFAQSLLSQKKPRFGASGPQTARVQVKRGKFKKTIKFRAAFYPGQVVLAGYASGSFGVVSFAGRMLKVPAPPEGIVVKKSGHSTGRAGVFAQFTFAPHALPRSGTVRETWFPPGGCSRRTYSHGCSFSTRASQIVRANVKGPPALTVGFWRCRLSSAQKTIAEVTIRVG